MDPLAPVSGRRRAWRAWRRRRPFGAGLLLVLGGAEILLVQRAGPPARCSRRGRTCGTRCRC
ncbi:DUF6114 domain-containing protein [Streptomyces sp. NPDC085479]|uniref:DUF6114 domain-containing protein n=1 Tax=Streptomyces sp. NPDC085479 TaxID=3365726 RepID=UPI0037CFE1B6